MKKKILITIGPIPGKLDSVKLVTNRFKGKLGLKTVEGIFDTCIARYGTVPVITVVCHENTEIDPGIRSKCITFIVKVKDVNDYVAKVLEYPEQDMYILSAAVANLIPARPYEKKFPSHNYKEGDLIEIPFVIAPRLVDRIKKKFPRSTLIAYKLYDGTVEELIKAAKLLQKESGADLVFANLIGRLTEKYKLNKNGVVKKCDWEDHVSHIVSMMDVNYYKTVIRSPHLYYIDELNEHIEPWMLLGITQNKDQETHGSFAWSFDNKVFLTTTRGHKNGNCVLLDVDHEELKVVSEFHKPCPLAPTYHAIFNQYRQDVFIVHTHEEIGRHDCKIKPVPAGTKECTNLIIRALTILSENGKTPEKEIVIKMEEHGYLVIFPYSNDADAEYAKNKMKIFSITGEWNV